MSASITYIAPAKGARSRKQRSNIEEDLFAEAKPALYDQRLLDGRGLAVASETPRGAAIFDIRCHTRSVAREFLCASELAQGEMQQPALDCAADSLDPLESWLGDAMATVGGGYALVEAISELETDLCATEFSVAWALLR